MTKEQKKENIGSLVETRYDRQELIKWWDQSLLERTRVLVVGAGALGNEIVKLLALTGVGRVVLIDMDSIEMSNLSRGVLFRNEDLGRWKVDCVAQRAMELNPDVTIHPVNGNLITQCGMGLFYWADVVIGAVDNREARVFINNACAATSRTWIDGAIESFSGVVRVFDPQNGPCYECTMSETDHTLLGERQSCARLAREAASMGHVPTTAIAASIIAGFQTMETLKLLHGQPTITGEGIHIEGWSEQFTRVKYPKRDECLGHERFPKPISLGIGTCDTTARKLLELAKDKFGDDVVLDLSRDLVLSLYCPKCSEKEPGRVAVGGIKESDAKCQKCGEHRILDFTSYLSWDTEIDLDSPLSELGVPNFDVVVVRRNIEQLETWLFDGDASSALGPLASSFELNEIPPTKRG